MNSHIFRNDGQASKCELATRLITCPACNAPAGTGCGASGEFKAQDTIDFEPHVGRVDLLEAFADYVVKRHGLVNIKATIQSQLAESTFS